MISLTRLWRSKLTSKISTRRTGRTRLHCEALDERIVPTTWFVSNGGNDGSAGTAPNVAFQSIQRAINAAAATGDTIEVSTGTYGYVSSQDINYRFLGENAVAVILNKQLNLIGGYNTNFSARDVNANPTVIDGGGATHGVYLLSSVQTPGSAALVLDGFTVQRGYAQPKQSVAGGPTFSGTDLTFTFGGGLTAIGSYLTVRNTVFQNNTSQGRDGSAAGLAYGGAGSGGGMAVRSMAGTVELTNVAFNNNKAQGGTGSSLGGFGLGGGYFANQANVQMTNVSFTSDQAIAGATNGSGQISGMDFADGIGGGAYMFQASASMNIISGGSDLAQGGYAPNGQAGGGIGGALHFEKSTVSGFDWNLRNNTAQGGTGITAGLSYGGGFEFFDTSGNVDRGFVINNTSLGGQGLGGSPQNGPPQGGGIAFFNPTNGNNTANITNFVIAGNHVSMANTSQSTVLGGGGGGVSDQGQNVGFYHSTFADNTVNTSDLHGAALLVFGQGTPFSPTLTLQYDIFANEVQRTSAIHGFNGSTINETRNLFFNNTNNDNSGGATDGPNGHSAYNFSGGNPNLNGDPMFASAGSPNYDYNTLAGSAAIDQADGSGAQDDAYNHARIGTPDIGAVEHQSPSLAFSAGTYTVGQQDGSVTVTVFRAGLTAGTLDVTLSTADGTATAGTDYTRTSTTVHFAANQTSASVSVPILFPQVNPGSRTFQVQLSNPSDASTTFPSGTAAGVVIYGANADGSAEYDPSHGQWYLRGTANAGASLSFPFGGTNWRPLVGDWDGNGTGTVGVVDPSSEKFYLRNTNSAGPADVTPFSFGAAGWTPVAGDWDGNGVTTVGAVDPSSSTFYLRNTNNAGAADIVMQFGARGWIPVVGHWDGGTTTEIGVVDPATETWYLNTASGVVKFQFGAPGWKPVVGDWDGDGVDNIGVVDPNGTWYLRYTNTAGPVDSRFGYGLGSWSPAAGDFNGPGGAPQLAASPAASPAAAAALTQAQLDATVQAALGRLRAAGLGDASLATLASASYKVGTLPGLYLGLTVGNSVTLDATAAGHGWFVDATPADDAEFDLSADGATLTAKSGAAAGREDLLTVVLHEMGHVLGRPSTADAGGLMSAWLADGVRRTNGLAGVFRGA